MEVSKAYCTCQEVAHSRAEHTSQQNWSDQKLDDVGKRVC